MRVEDGFQQSPFLEEHPYSTDPVLPSLLKRLLPALILEEVEADLLRLGDKIVKDIRPLSGLVQPATLTQYDQWGRRIDNLQTSEGWRLLKDSSIEEGYVANAFERERFGKHSRTYMFAKNMVMTGDYHVIMCPFGMTDGAARVIELLGTERMKTELYPRLISRNPAVAYLSGQWMTERPGGSDLSQTETVATRVEDTSEDLGPSYVLNGFKWFSSAAEGNMALAIARTGSKSDGSRGLSLFLVPLRLPGYPSPLSNGVLMHRLKNKIGTFGVPTAELSLQSTRAWLVGPLNGGIKAIVAMLNITRIHSAIHCVGSLQRCLAIARAYSKVRSVKGGTLLQDVPMHVASLAQINVLYRALTHLTFGAVVLLGKSEVGESTAEEEDRLRLLTPTVKAYAAFKAPPAMMETMAALGGLGYMEEVGIGRLLRDSMVEQIWEGTLNILALDLIRAAKEEKRLESYMKWAHNIISEAVDVSTLQKATDALRRVLDSMPFFFSQGLNEPLAPRVLLNIFACVSAGVYLLEHALWSRGQPCHAIDAETFRRWVLQGELQSLVDEVHVVFSETNERYGMNSALVYTKL